MLTGLPPYFSKSTHKIQDNILNKKLEIPTDLSEDCQDLLKRLLSKDPVKRLGYKHGVEEILAHKWFDGIELEQIQQKKLTPYQPYLMKTVRVRRSHF